MTRVSHHYPEPIHGVSTLAARNRAEGQAEVQENMRSDPVEKLTRRPSAFWEALLATGVTAGTIIEHNYRRNDKDFKIIVKDDGTVLPFVDLQLKSITGSIASYVDTADSLVLNNINDTTFVINTQKVVAMLPNTDASDVEGVTHINITSAMNYGETITIDIELNGGATHTVSYTTPDLGDPPNYDVADKARASAKVAEELAALINAITGVTSIAKSSSIAIWEDAFPNGFVHTQVQTGQGDRSATVINKTSQDTEGFPLYAVNGTVVNISPDPQSSNGKYFLKAVATNPDSIIAATPAARVLEEVTWVETRDPDQPYAFDATTMPHTILYDEGTDSFTCGEPPVGWDERKAGDDDSVKVPTFVGTTIDNISYMQRRLVLLADNTVEMTKTNDIYDFWKASANRLVTSDPISIASSAMSTDSLKHMIPHNKDLLVLAQNAQFKIPGDTAITPETVAMPLTTEFECQTDVAPVAMGNAVFFPTTYGESSGVQEYTAQRNTTQDKGEPITHHVIGYLPGNLTHLTASPNLEMLALTTSGSLSNELFVCEQFTEQGKKLQLSWSKWTLPAGNVIEGLHLSGDRLDVLVNESGNLVLKRINMYASISRQRREQLFIDDRVELTSTDGLTVTLPANYPIDANTRVYGDTNAKYPLQEETYTINGSVLTFTKGSILPAGASEANVIIGRRYTSKYKPTRPFIYSEGIPDTTDPIRVSAFFLSVVDTSELSMKITSDYFDDTQIDLSARIVGQNSFTVGKVPFETNDWKFPFKNKADLADAEFFTDSPYNLTIAGIRWEGLVNKTSKRI